MTTIWIVETETGTLETTDYELAKAWNRSHPGSTLDRADNQP